MDRVFLGANVLFSAAYRSDSRLRQLFTLHDATLVTSAYAREEARRNLTTAQQRKDLEQLCTPMDIVVATLLANYTFPRTFTCRRVIALSSQPPSAPTQLIS